MKILTIAGAKGGVGKSTTAVTLAAELAARGRRVALLDLDPQGSATLALGQDPVADPSALHPVSFQMDLLSREIRLYPGGRSLARAGAGDVSRLLQEAATRDLDVLIVDTPPFLGALTVGALERATLTLVPVEPAPMALPALRDVANVLTEFGARPRAVLVRVQGRRVLSADIRGIIEEEYPGALYRAEIPEDVKAAEAPAFGLPVTLYAPRSRAAEAYQELGTEVFADLEVGS